MPESKSIINDLGLAEVLDLESVQGIQDRLAELAGVTVTICDEAGIPITESSCASRFCSLLATSNSGRAACFQSITQIAGHAMAHAPGSDDHASPKTAQCHAGLAQVTVPIDLDGRNLGAIVIGDRPRVDLDSTTITRLALEHHLDESELAGAAAELETWPPDREVHARRLAQLLAEVVGRMYQQELQLRLRVRELSTVYGLSGLIAKQHDWKDVLGHVARQVAEVMRVKATGIRLLDEETGELVIQAVYNLSDDYLNKGPVLLGHNPIDAAAFRGESVYIEDARTDPRIRYPEQSREEGLVSGMCVPLAYGGKTIGVLRVYTGEVYRFTRYEKALLRSIASQTAALIINARLLDERLESERIARQFQYAGEIQRQTLPENAPEHPGIQFGFLYEPTLEVSGDFYDFIDLPWGNVGLAVADVVGKGVPAALMMASVRAALRAFARGVYDLTEIMSLVNRHMHRETRIGEFATMFYGVFSPDGRQLTYCNAGHDPPLMIRGDSVKKLETGGTLIGVVKDAVYNQEVLHLEPGDVLLFYTDGAIDAMNFDGEMYGRERLLESFIRHRSLDVQALIQQIVWDIRRFAGLATQSDDITVVAAKVIS